MRTYLLALAINQTTGENLRLRTDTNEEEIADSASDLSCLVSCLSSRRGTETEEYGGANISFRSEKRLNIHQS